MTIALTEDHVALADTAADFLARHDATGAARALLEAPAEERPSFWGDLAQLGWTGLHLGEDVGGSGFGIDELVVVVEALGRTVAPGPFVPTAIAGAVIDRAGSPDVRTRLLPGIADGTTAAGVSLVGEAAVSGSGDGATVDGSFAAVLGASVADLLVLPSGDDVVVVPVGGGVTIETPPNLDPTRRSSRVTLAGASATVIPGGRRLLVDLGRVVLSAEAVGIAATSTEQAAAYAKERIQFGRPIAMFQAVKHHCANMAVATELATAAVWDAARAASVGGEQLTIAAATAATLAGPAADLCANLSTQVFGGIAITWEHDAHLSMRRAEVLLQLLRPSEAAEEVTDLTRRGVVRARTVDLPPEAEAFRDEVRAVIERVKDLDAAGQRRELASSGYAMPHWPAPYGRDAGPVEQLVIEQELSAAGVKRPSYGITGWNILTILQHGTDDQIGRWVRPALDEGVIWCQLFSEPDAGSDAAGVKTKATRVDGGWLVNGQKVWTSGAHVAAMGFATVRTNSEVKKHDGITMMAIDMHAEGVEVRPLKMVNGGAEFNEVFFNDVFVPDDDVVGPVDGGWTVARATLGNESVSIGSGDGGMALPAASLIAAHDANPDRLDGGAARIGRYAATIQSMGLLNLRSANRAVAGGGPGPEGAITKLVLSELGHEAAAALHALGGDDSLYTDGAGFVSSTLLLMHRAMSIAGGTSEIKRNQIGERILGLPRDPLIN